MKLLRVLINKARFRQDLEKHAPGVPFGNNGHVVFTAGAGKLGKSIVAELYKNGFRLKKRTEEIPVRATFVFDALPPIEPPRIDYGQFRKQRNLYVSEMYFKVLADRYGVVNNKFERPYVEMCGRRVYHDPAVRGNEGFEATDLEWRFFTGMLAYGMEETKARRASVEFARMAEDDRRRSYPYPYIDEVGEFHADMYDRLKSRMYAREVLGYPGKPGF